MPEKKMNIPFSKPWIGKEEINEVIDTLQSGWLTTGPKCEAFEKKLADYNSVKHAIVVDSCTAALHISLAAEGIGAGDEVITTPFTFCSTVNVILFQGAKPVLADIDSETFNISPAEIKKKISKKTKAIIPVHYGGQSCSMDEINEIAEKHGLAVVEDAAHALGAEYKGKKCGTLGKYGCFSFYPIKNITTGEGGAVVTDSDAAAEQLRCLRYCGIKKDAWKRYYGAGSWYYEVTQLGFKYNMSDVLASIGLRQMDKLDKSILMREKIAGRYSKAFGAIEGIAVPEVKENVKHAWHLYAILLDVENMKIDRNQFIEQLKKAGIAASVNFIPIHFHPYYKSRFGFNRGDFPNSEFAFERIVSLPLYPTMSKAETDYVIDNVIAIVEKNKKS